MNNIDPGDSLTLNADVGGEIFATAKAPVSKNSFIAVISKSQLPTGVVRLTLSTTNGGLVNQRLLFNQNHDNLNISIAPVAGMYSPHQKMQVAITAVDEGKRGVAGNFSVAVIDGAQIPEDEPAETTILTNLLLSSDVSGYIEKPAYYFSGTKKSTDDPDILMMTQGYSRFEWKKNFDDSSITKVFIPQKNLSITGTITHVNGSPLPRTKITLIGAVTGILQDTLTDDSGHFTFYTDFGEGAKFSVKVEGVNTNDIKIKLDDGSTYALDRSNTITYPRDLKPEQRASDQQFGNLVKSQSSITDFGIKQLKQVNINATRQKEKDIRIQKAVEHSANLNGKGMADQIITEETFAMGCITVADCLTGRLSGVTFDQLGRPQSSKGRSSILLGTEMLVVIDGIISQTGSVNEVDPESIAGIEVLKSAGTTTIYGIGGANGVLVITTKHDDGFKMKQKSTADIYPRGYYKAHEFYSPKYLPDAGRQNEDLRTTIFWSPIIQTDANGKAAFEYYNSDSKGPYRIIVEGIDYKTGKIGRQVYSYTASQGGK